MIKINLVAETPSAPSSKKIKGPEINLGARPGDTILIVVLVLAAAVAGGRWWMLSSKLEDLRVTERERRKERDELQQYIKKVDELEAKREALRQKIDVINTLKANQSGPVRIMDEVSRALPDLVWLTGMSFNGQNLSLTGKAMDENAVANYIANLNSSPFFQEPILKNLRRSGKAGAQTFDFQLECLFNPAPPELAEGQG